jgi:GTP-binding protein
MINKYLETSEDIEEVIQFVDIRHDPSKQDIQMFDFVKQSTGFEPIVILTKVDKIKRSQVKKQAADIRKCLNATENCVMIPFSAETKQGLQEIYKIVDDIIDSPGKPE